MSRTTGADGEGPSSPGNPTNAYASEEKSRRPKGEALGKQNGKMFTDGGGGGTGFGIPEERGEQGRRHPKRAAWREHPDGEGIGSVHT